MVGKNFSPCVCVVLVYTCFSANARTNASARFEKYSNPLVDVCVCVEVVHSRFFFSTLTRLRRWCESVVNLSFVCLLQEPEMCLRLKVPMKCLTH